MDPQGFTLLRDNLTKYKIDILLFCITVVIQLPLHFAIQATHYSALVLVFYGLTIPAAILGFYVRVRPFGLLISMIEIVLIGELIYGLCHMRP